MQDAIANPGPPAVYHCKGFTAYRAAKVRFGGQLFRAVGGGDGGGGYTRTLLGRGVCVCVCVRVACRYYVRS